MEQFISSEQKPDKSIVSWNLSLLEAGARGMRLPNKGKIALRLPAFLTALCRDPHPQFEFGNHRSAIESGVALPIG
jgi:hypothetical protein